MKIVFFTLVILLCGILLCLSIVWVVTQNRSTSSIPMKSTKNKERAKRVHYIRHNDTKGTLVVDYKTIPTFMSGTLKFGGKVTLILSSNSDPAECYISDVQYNGTSLFKDVDSGSSNSDKVNYSLDALRKLRDKGIIAPNLVYTIEEVAKEVYDFNILLKKGVVCLTKNWGYTYNYDP